MTCPETTDVIISIGLPVYNGENYLAEAIESLLAQSFQDMEIIISDNASTDRTAAICAHYQALDPRIRYHRNDTNIGAAENFNQVFHRAKGTYFKWASHDDRCAPDYVEKCVEVLRADPSVVLCHSEIVIIDDDGHVVETFDPDLPQMDSPLPSKRFQMLTRTNHYCYDVFGVIRTCVLRETPLIASYIASDHCLLVELALCGRMHRIPEPLFFARDHAGRSIRSLKLRDRGAWFNPALKGRLSLPFLRRLLEFVRCIHRVPCGFHEKCKCYAFIPVWIMNNRSLLLDDARHGIRHLLHRVGGHVPRGESEAPLR